MLALRLPLEGVETSFPDEDACRRRLAEVHWSNEPSCIRCASRDIGYLKTRDMFRCKSCGYQFSHRIGTPLEGAHVHLRTWFHFAEIIIISYAYSPAESWRAGSSLRATLKLSHATVVKRRRYLRETLMEPDGGFVGRCICPEQVALPAGIEPGTMAHFSWAQEAVIDRFLRRPPRLPPDRARSSPD
ncbi:transposase [Pseudogemmobacter sonorensis]|uniref:transposase n=1 Tax=Pseudogemmobacter sonorensis TaxID=2989681 RepID=UPI003F671089